MFTRISLVLLILFPPECVPLFLRVDSALVTATSLWGLNPMRYQAQRLPRASIFILSLPRHTMSHQNQTTRGSDLTLFSTITADQTYQCLPHETLLCFVSYPTRVTVITESYSCHSTPTSWRGYPIMLVANTPSLKTHSCCKSCGSDVHEENSRK